MKKSQNPRVDEFLSEMFLASPDSVDMINSIRKIFLGTHKDLSEDIKYGGVVFNLRDKLIGGVYSYKDHISIEFSNGADLLDSDGVLEGKGKKRRHLKIITEDDIKSKSVQSFADEAVKL